jgi:hypothetical protein
MRLTLNAMPGHRPPEPHANGPDYPLPDQDELDLSGKQYTEKPDSELPPRYDNYTDLEIDHWIYNAKFVELKTWPKVLAAYAKISLENEWKPITSEPAMRARMQNAYFPGFLKRDYTNCEPGNPLNKQKAEQKRGSSVTPKRNPQA